MLTLTLIVFVLVYLGLFLGGLPFVQLDRTGVALLGAIVLVATEITPMDQIWSAVHPPTLALLFAFMVISAQLRLSGFYDWVVWRLDRLGLPDWVLLGAVIWAAAVLSAIFSNDIVCLAMAPVLAETCRARRFNPVPFLLALACASNIGSAATLIGNPQNMLIGERLGLNFTDYLSLAAAPVGLGLGGTWAIALILGRWRWQQEAISVSAALPQQRQDDQPIALDRWQTFKGLGVTAGLLIAFFIAPWPRDLLALAGAGILLTSRRLHSQHMLGLVDWQLLVLFIGLFIVNHAFQQTGLPGQIVAALARCGFDLHNPGPLFVASAILSNLVSNVPAVMLLLPTASDPLSGPALALSSTLAGNLVIASSIANIIVIQAAARHGLIIAWSTHAQIGIPVTLSTLAIAGWWLGLIGPP